MKVGRNKHHSLTATPNGLAHGVCFFFSPRPWLHPIAQKVGNTQLLEDAMKRADQLFFGVGSSVRKEEEDGFAGAINDNGSVVKGTSRHFYFSGFLIIIEKLLVG
jgi:hypothetical protein